LVINGGDDERRGMNLYRIHTITDDFREADGVEITWVAVGREAPPAPYAEAIRDPLPGSESYRYQRSRYQQSAVDELFTHEEAEAWVAYLRKHYGDESAEIVEQPLPLTGDAMGLTDLPLGGGQDLLVPAKEDDYPFSFEVYGYYDFRQHWDDLERMPRSV